MIKEIMAHIKDEGLEITFYIDSGNFDDAILETIESLGCWYIIKGKGSPTLVVQVTDRSIPLLQANQAVRRPSLSQPWLHWTKAEDLSSPEYWKMKKIERKSLSWKAKYTTISFLSPTRNNRQMKWLNSMKNAGTVRITSRKPSVTWRLYTCCSSHFGPIKRSFSWWCWHTICFCCLRWTS